MRCIWGMRIQYNCIKGSYYNILAPVLIRLVYVHTDRIDTVMNDQADYVTVFYFEHSDKNRPGENRSSKHLIGYHNQAMVFYDVADEVLVDIKQKRKEEAKQAMELLKEAAEAVKNVKPDTVQSP